MELNLFLDMMANSAIRASTVVPLFREFVTPRMRPTTVRNVRPVGRSFLIGPWLGFLKTIGLKRLRSWNLEKRGLGLSNTDSWDR